MNNESATEATFEPTQLRSAVNSVASAASVVSGANYPEHVRKLDAALHHLENVADSANREIERLRAMEKRAKDSHLVAYGEESQVIGYILYGERD